MAKFFATLIDEIQQELQDTGGATWADPELTIQLEDAIREVSEYDQYEMMETFEIESRTGSATTTTSDKLVDSAGQFLSTDVGKEIYNTTDRTWAVVTAYDDANTLSISKDIMVSGEEYAMFNKGCRNKYQINIEDVTDFIDPPELGVARGYVEHPIGNKRNFTLEGDILTIDVNRVDDSADSDADVEVYVWFKKKHRVSQLADLAGTVNGTPAAGAKTFTIAAVGSGTDVIAEDTLFSVVGVRGTYRVRYDLTLSGGGGALVFWTGLESAPANGAVVAFVGSTLNTRLERLVVELTAARAFMSKWANEIPKGGAGTYARYETKLAIVLGKLETLSRSRKPVSKHVFPKD